MDEEFVTVILISNQVLLTKLVGDVDENGFYVFKVPLKPLIIPDSNKVALVAMNPFSNSVEYRIHSQHIISIGIMDIGYIDMYNNAVDALFTKTKSKYDKLLDLDDEEYDDESDLNILEISNTLH